jgi:AcrR family transcriptional regulator
VSARSQAPAHGHDQPQRPLRRDALANQERVLAAAVTAILREGRQVPMATITAEAGVGVATLYLRYPHREALLDALTHHAFELLLEQARAAEAREDTALARLSWWWDRVIDQRDQLVLPLGGGPPVTSTQTLAVQSQLHQSLQHLLERGHRDGASGTTSPPATWSSSARCWSRRCPAPRTGTAPPGGGSRSTSIAFRHPRPSALG